MGFFTRLAYAVFIAMTAIVAWKWMSLQDLDPEFYREKRVIVTGASKGIGRSLAIQLAQLGAKVVVAARSEDKLAEVQKECLQYSAHVHTVVADVSREEDCRAIVEKTVSEFGGIDILILNAAYQPDPYWFNEFENPGKTFSDTYKVNVLQSVYLVQQSLPYLNTSRGTIVPVSSGGAGFLAIPKLSAYVASKHALQGFFKSLNQEFVLTGTPVTITIMPLPLVITDTAVHLWKPKGLTQGISAEDCASRMLRGIPLRRLWHYVDWQGFFLGHLYHMFPEFFDYLLRTVLPYSSDNF